MWNFFSAPKDIKAVPDVCDICSEVIGTVRQDGSTEVAYTLPCSHTFGNICILSWMDIAPQKDCPNCRRKLVHPGCGHLIMPHKSSTAPPSIAASQTPENCVRCRGDGAVASELETEQKRLELQEQALRGMRVNLPRFFGTQAVGTVSTVDQRIAELRKGFAGFHERTWRKFEDRERREEW